MDSTKYFLFLTARMKISSRRKIRREVHTMKPKKKKTPNVLAHQSAQSNSDVLGSYTGTPKDGGQPTQDADDL